MGIAAATCLGVVVSGLSLSAQIVGGRAFWPAVGTTWCVSAAVMLITLVGSDVFARRVR